MSIRDCRPVVLSEEEKEALRLEEVEQAKVDIEPEESIGIAVPTGPSVAADST